MRDVADRARIGLGAGVGRKPKHVRPVIVRPEPPQPRPAGTDGGAGQNRPPAVAVEPHFRLRFSPVVLEIEILLKLVIVSWAAATHGATIARQRTRIARRTVRAGSHDACRNADTVENGR